VVTHEFDDVVRQVDDSLLWADSVEACFHKTARYLTLLGKHGILQIPDKFRFCKKEINWSGFVIGPEKVKPMAHISAAIRNFPTPQNKTDMRSFMALAQQISYATAVAPQLLPFRTLLKAGTAWEWNQQHDDIFVKVKDHLSSAVEEGITLFDPLKLTLLVTDYSKYGVGFLLLQKQCSCQELKNDGTLNSTCCNTGWQVTMVGSRFTRNAEPNYSPTEGELLAVGDALKKTKYLTLGCPRFYVGTDHKPLLGIFASRDLDAIDNPRLVKLKEKTLGWIFTPVYIPGKKIGDRNHGKEKICHLKKL